jgi:hypothetical protein
MAHFAEVDENNVVTRVIVVANAVLLDGGVESEQKGVDFCVAHYGGRWIQTSYNDSFRGYFAGAGFKYDPVADLFIAPEVIDETETI